MQSREYTGHNGKTVWRRECASWEEFARHCETAEAHVRSRTSRESAYHYKNWTGAATWEDAVRMAVHGEDAVRERITALSQRMQAKLASVAGAILPELRHTWDVAGDWVDVGRYLEGEPECMASYQWEEVERPGRFVRIAAAIFVSANVDADAVRRGGAALAALVDILEARGYRCEIIGAGVMTGDTDRHWYMSFPIKRAGDALDLTRLSYCLACPGMFRRYMFSAMECEPNDSARREMGAGSFYSRPPSEFCNVVRFDRQSEPVDITFAPGTTIAKGADGCAETLRTDADAEAWIEAMLRKLAGGVK